MDNRLIISVYGSHNAAIAMYYKGEYHVVEVERWTNIKNSGLTTYLPVSNPQFIFDEITNYLLSKTDGEDVDVFLTGYADSIKPKFNFKEKIVYDHHTAHAADAFYQSNYEEMLVFTFDGGGDGSFFNVYLADRKNGIRLVDKFNHDLGFPYMLLGEILDDIKREDLSIGNLVYAGKLMGLCAYGKVREEWMPHFMDFYSKFKYDGVSYIGGTQVMREAMTTLMKNIGIDDYEYGISRYKGEIAWDIAATTQAAFEETFYNLARPYLEKYPDMPIGMSGGCALNVLLNTRLSIERGGNVFVPPNVNDCGIAVGAILWYLNPREAVDLTYSGLPVMDENMLAYYINKYGLTYLPNVTPYDIAKYMAKGKIIGLIQGNSEHGSRALGNRSIICSPTGNMKDVINFKVKKREWYRPFAPVVKLEDISKYFHFGQESRHMTFAPLIKEEYRDMIPAVTHVDGTGRVQTVTREQNQLLYDIINEFEKITNIGVILNTSFNVNGKPILTTLSDAFDLLNKSDMDAIYFRNTLVIKNRDFFDFKVKNNTQTVDRNNNDLTGGKIFNCVVIDTSLNNENLQSYITKLSQSVDNLIYISPHLENVDIVEDLNLKNVGTVFIGQEKFYHSDRMVKFFPFEKCQNRLKLIWFREMMSKGLTLVGNTAIIDISDGTNVSKLFEQFDKFIKNGLYLDEFIFHQDRSSDGFGILIGDPFKLLKITDIVESRLLYDLEKTQDGPLTEKEYIDQITKQDTVNNMW